MLPRSANLRAKQQCSSSLPIHYYLLLATSLLLHILTVCAIVFDEVSSLHIWITISSLANKDPNNAKALLFRQVELNWINAPLDDENDYIGLYLDSEPDSTSLPVSVHKLNGQMNGQIITDYYLPHLDFFNETHEYAAQLLSTHQDADKIHRRSISGYQQQQQLSDEQVVSGRRQLRLNDECIGYCIAYHSRNKIFARNCFKTNPNWMRDSFQYIGSRPLPSLMIPGTHNSATYPRQLDRTALHMINKYQMNQDESIFNQLIHGIRQLDLRIGYSKVKQRPERFWIYHDIFRTEVSVNEVLSQVRRFLDLTSHEIIIVDFHRFTVGFQNENAATQRERHAKLVNLIHKHLGSFIVPSYLGQHAPLNEYVATGKRVIVGYANKAIITNSLSQIGASEQLEFAGGQDTRAKLNARERYEQVDNSASSSSAVGAASTTAAISDNETVSRNGSGNDRSVGTKLFNRLKTFKLITNSFSRRSSTPDRNSAPELMRLSSATSNEMEDEDTTLSGHYELAASRAALFFSPVRHLWPNKDTVEGLAQYMNETTCRKYFGELRAMMVELTPTVFGAISDKYDGNRKLAQSVNRQVSDWIRDRWLHCINIVASDYFLGNDLIRLSIYANKMRVLHRDVDLNSYGQCSSFRKIEHLLDKSKIPIQFAYAYEQQQSVLSSSSSLPNELKRDKSHQNDLITHTSADGNQILLRPLKPSHHYSGARERRDSFVDNVSDGFTNLVSSFKRLLNL